MLEELEIRETQWMDWISSNLLTSRLQIVTIEDVLPRRVSLVIPSNSFFTHLTTLVLWSTLYISFFRFFTFLSFRASALSLPKISHPPHLYSSCCPLVLALNVLCENTLYT